MSSSNEAEFESTNDYQCITQVQNFKANLKWSVTQLSQQALPLESCPFGAYNPGGENWKLKLDKSNLHDVTTFASCSTEIHSSSKGDDATNERAKSGWYALWLSFDCYGEKIIGVKYKIYLVAKDLKPLMVVDNYSDYRTALVCLGKAIKGPFNFFLNDLKNYAPNDELNVVCELSWRKMVSKISKELHFNHLEVSEIHKKGRESLFSLFKDGTLCDVKLSCKDERKISAHRIILSAHSPVFADRLHNDALGDNKGLIIIEDFDSAVVEKAMSLFYRGHIPETAITLDLFKFVHKYGQEVLKSYIESKLITRISNENACEMLLQGHLLKYPLLKETGLAFISKNIAQISSRKEFRELMRDYPDLVCDCFSKIS